MKQFGTFFKNFAQSTRFFFSKQNKEKYAMVPEKGIVAGVSVFPDCSRKTMEKYYPSSLKLRSVIFIHRHGSRTPVGTISEKKIGFFTPEFCKNLETNLIKKQHSLKNISSENEENGPMMSYRKKNSNDMSPFRIVFDKTKNHSPDEKLRLVAGSKKKVENLSEIASNNDRCYPGQLTDIGYTFMGSLGKRLRELYVEKLGFLPEKYNPELVHFRSTQYVRALESVHALANSLYPNPETRHIIQTRARKYETLQPSPECARYMELNNAHIERETEKHKDTLDKINKKVAKALGVDEIKEPLKRIWDVLHSRYVHGMHTPKGITLGFIKKMEILKTNILKGFTVDEEAFRLGSGRLMQEIAENIRKTHWAATTSGAARDPNVPAEAPPLLSILSGHDSTLCPLTIYLLGIRAGEWPSFGSNITFELLSEKTKKAEEVFYVRTKHNDKFIALPKCAGHEHPTDKTLCRMSRFLEICDNATPKNYEEECKPKNK
ncbi:MAG: histidine acid phosphatase [Amphiamblys sp. WSBS2006]|nr:MAG: histidine acid phosphatase [Amphiamblys sp. WSBS2006]